MPFVPPAALMYLLGDVFDGQRLRDDPASVPLLTPHAGGGLSPRLCGLYAGGPRMTGHAKRCGGRRSGQ